MSESGSQQTGSPKTTPHAESPASAAAPGTLLEHIEGVVKWFDPRKGYGFVVGPQGQDIFVHYSVIQGEGFRVLTDGAEITYDAHKTSKGWKATKVTRRESIEVTQTVKKGYSRTPRR